jgi:hypothetical protein
MKKKQLQPSRTTIRSPKQKTDVPEKETLFCLPPGVRLGDVYIDQQDVAQQLKLCKRVIRNMRVAGKLSYTYLEERGKYFYLVQEIAAILKANTVIGKNSLLKKIQETKCFTTFTGLYPLVSLMWCM